MDHEALAKWVRLGRFQPEVDGGGWINGDVGGGEVDGRVKGGGTGELCDSEESEEDQATRRQEHDMVE